LTRDGAIAPEHANFHALLLVNQRAEYSVRRLNIVNTAENEEVMYTLVVYGYAPELWSARVAFRREKGFDVIRKKVIKCPYCGRSLVSVDQSTRIEIYRYQRGEKRACHEYKTCHVCHEKVGIVFS
jgi:ribosomal protein L34E